MNQEPQTAKQLAQEIRESIYMVAQEGQNMDIPKELENGGRLENLPFRIKALLDHAEYIAESKNMGLSEEERPINVGDVLRYFLLGRHAETDESMSDVENTDNASDDIDLTEDDLDEAIESLEKAMQNMTVNHRIDSGLFKKLANYVLEVKNEEGAGLGNESVSSQ